MNKVFKVVFNKATGTYLAVSEYAKGQGKGKNTLQASKKQSSYVEGLKTFKFQLMATYVTLFLYGSYVYAEVYVNNNVDGRCARSNSDGKFGIRNSETFGSFGLKPKKGTTTPTSANPLCIPFDTSNSNNSNNADIQTNRILMWDERDSKNNIVTTHASFGGDVYLNKSLKVKSGASIDMGDNQITKVADATADDHAVNYGQLKAAQTHYYSVNDGAAITPPATVSSNKNNDGAYGKDALAAGVSARAEGKKSVAIGSEAFASEEDAYALGSNSKAEGQNSVALGTGSNATSTDAIAIGNKSFAKKQQAIVIGSDNTADGAYAIVIGSNAQKRAAESKGYAAIAIGSGGGNQGAFANGESSVAIGGGNKASTGTLNGASTTADATNAVAIGSGSSAEKASVVAVGSKSKATKEGAVALGSESVANRDVPTVSGYDANTGLASTKTNATWRATRAAVSVGNGTTNTRQITSVAAGSEATDAVNVAQLKAVAQAADRQNYFHVNNGSNAGGSTTTNLAGVDEAGGARTTDSIAIGRNAISGFIHPSDPTKNKDAIAIGKSASATGSNAIAIGREVQATQTNAAATGFRAKATGVNTVAYGTVAIADKNDASAFGVSAKAQGLRSTAVGRSAQANQINATATGYAAKATGINSSAYGTVSIADKNDASAFGVSAKAQGLRSTAIGRAANATKDDAIAVGYVSKATGVRAIAMGRATEAKANYTTAVGSYSDATKIGSQAIGYGAQATGNYANATGYAAKAKQDFSNAQGFRANADGRHAIAVGTYSAATANNTTAVGSYSDATKIGSQAVGFGAQAIGNYANANGYSADAIGRYSNATGYDAKAKQDFSNAQGYRANADGRHAIAVGTYSAATANNTTAIGSYSDATKIGSQAVGFGAQAIGNYANANGYSADAIGRYSNATGYDAKAKQDFSNAQGYRANADGRHAIAVGTYSAATANNTTAVGSYTDATKTGAIATGYGAQATGSYALASGYGADAKADYSNAIGYDAQANSAQSIAIGRLSRANSKADSIALGSQSVATVGAGVVGYDPSTGLPSTTTNTTWRSNRSALSIGNGTTITRQITSVAAGKNDTDAVNVAQLKALRTGVIGYTTGAGGFALKAQDANTVTQSLGAAIEVVGTGNDATATYSGNNLKTAVNSRKIEIQMTDRPTFGNVKINNNGTGKITGLTAGTISNTSKDAVNGSQLYQLGNTVATSLGGSSTFNTTTGQVTAGLSVGGTTYNTVQKALDKITSTAGINNTASAGKNIVVTPTTNTDGSKNYEIKTKDDVVFTKTTVGSVVTNATTNKISGLSNGDINNTSTDAVNGSQIHAISNANKNIFGGNATVNNDGTVTMTNVGGTGKDNIHDAIASINATAGKHSTVSAGDNITVTPVTTSGKTDYKVATKKSVEFDNVKVGNVVINKNTGINAGNKQVTNVASGLGSRTLNQIKSQGSSAPEWNNAVTVGDLTTVQGSVSTLGNNYQQTLGNTYVNANGELTTDGKLALKTYNVDGQGEFVNNSVISAVKNINNEGIKFFHTNDETAGSDLARQDSNNIDSSAGGAYSTAIGYQAKVSNIATNGIAIGKGAQANAENTISIGTGNIVNGKNSGAIGDPSVINGANSYSMGNNNTVDVNVAQGAFILGNSVDAKVDNSVYLGNDSHATAGAGVGTAVLKSDGTAGGTTSAGNSGTVTQATVGNITYGGFAGAKASGVVTVGASGTERRIQNVAAGELSATSTDAINGSQLNAVATQVSSNANGIAGNSIAISGNTNAILGNREKIAENADAIRVNAGNIDKLNNGGAGVVRYSNADSPTTPNGGTPSNDVTIVGANVNVPVRVHNVAAGRANTDAVNVGQLRQMGYDLDDRINAVDDKANGGIAGATAIAFLQTPREPGKSAMSLAIGGYRSEKALAIGYSNNSDNNKWQIKMGASVNTQSDVNYGGSVGLQW